MTKSAVKKPFMLQGIWLLGHLMTLASRYHHGQLAPKWSVFIYVVFIRLLLSIILTFVFESISETLLAIAAFSFRASLMGYGFICFHRSCKNQKKMTLVNKVVFTLIFVDFFIAFAIPIFTIYRIFI